MFSQIWKKYLPVIMILLKKVLEKDQTLAMNVSDFERASGGRKIKFNFSHLEINYGKLNTQIKQPEIARDLAQVLISHHPAMALLTPVKITFSLSGNCVLTIKNTTTASEVIEDTQPETEPDTQKTAE